MNTTIKTKLITGISAILVILFSTLFYMISRLSSLNQRMIQMVDIAAERIILSNEIRYHIMDISKNEKNIILEKNTEGRVGFKKEIDEAVGSVNKKLRQLEEKAGDQLMKQLEAFRKEWRQYGNVLNEMINLVRDNETDAAFRLSIGESRTLRYAITDLLEDVTDTSKAQMQQDKAATSEEYRSSIQIITVLVVLSLLLSAILTYWIIQTIASRIRLIAEDAKRIASREVEDISFDSNISDELSPVTHSLADILKSFREVTHHANEIARGDYAVKIIPKSSKDILGVSLNKMSMTLAETTAANERHNWLTTGQNLLNERLEGEQGVEKVTQNAIVFISEYVKANVGAVYLSGKRPGLELAAGYALDASAGMQEVYEPGEGLPGQAAAGSKMIHLTNLRQEHLRSASSIVDLRPENVIAVPFFKDQRLMGVIELGKIDPFTDAEKEFISNSMRTVGVAVAVAISRRQVQDLLEETQRQSEELQLQQEELKQINEELEEQAQNLRQQQEELQVTNEELEEQTQSVEMKNRELEAAKAEIERKNEEVELGSRYKSQFLANMSHELRTPLNSLLILSRDLAENKKGNLDESQVESAQIIYKGGTELLQLINEVLDLSKIEAGKMTVHAEEVRLEEVAENIRQTFERTALDKGLTLSLHKDPLLPPMIRTDPQRLNQILKNLLSNAIKFTQQGGIDVTFGREGEEMLAIEVKDTGIGIPREKQGVIFEAFRQADGGTSRKYGGTGLGLSISRDLARLLGGEIRLSSREGEGSVFTLVLPFHIQDSQEVHLPGARRGGIVNETNEAAGNLTGLSDDREKIAQDDKVLLIVEDDQGFATILMKQGRAKGFKTLVAATGDEGLRLARRFLPAAVILDLGLPDMDGGTVLSGLKADPRLRNIPVHIISARERTLDPIKAGAVEYITKPVSKDQLEEAFGRIGNYIMRKMKNLLIVEDDADARRSVKLLIGKEDVNCFEAVSGKEALEILEKNRMDCIVLDLGLPDMSGFELIRKIRERNTALPPVVVYTGKELTKEENEILQELAESIIIKGVKSEERLLDETALFLHRTVSQLHGHKHDTFSGLYNRDSLFENKKILIADDDMRNVFALSKVLKEQGMETVKAENGLKALEALEAHPEISLVLMDVMMPEMDGLEAIRRIRAMEKYKDLPIISLTAKAMKEDRKKCIEAGANDYISKPVELERLLSLMKIWMGK